jgi:hypothetical protein
MGLKSRFISCSNVFLEPFADRLGSGKSHLGLIYRGFGSGRYFGDNPTFNVSAMPPQ